MREIEGETYRKKESSDGIQKKQAFLGVANLRDILVNLTNLDWKISGQSCAIQTKTISATLMKSIALY